MAPKWDQKSISTLRAKNQLNASPLAFSWFSWVEVGSKNRSKIDQKMESKMECVFLSSKKYPKKPPRRPRALPGRPRTRRPQDAPRRPPFAFWGGQDAPRLSMTRQSAFRFELCSSRFWVPKWSQVGTKMGSKIDVNFERRFFKYRVLAAAGA